MAVTKIWAIKGTLKSVVDYAANPDKTLNEDYNIEELQSLKDVIDYAVESEKTEMQYYVSGINCNPEFARDQMSETKKIFAKQDGIIAFHGYQSFKPGEVTPELAHKIGKELAQKLWGDRHEVLIATHLDRGHIHNHFVVNSVSMVDGKKFNACKQSYAQMRKVSDEICRENGLSIVENPHKAPRRMQYLAEKNGQSTKYKELKYDIDECLSRSSMFKIFVWEMEKRGYEFDFNRPQPTVNHKQFDRPVWLCDLGEGYSIEDIEEEIINRTYRSRRIIHDTITLKTLFFDGDPYSYKRSIKNSYECMCRGIVIIQQHPYCSEAEFFLAAEIMKFDQMVEEQHLILENNVECYEDVERLYDESEKELQELSDARNSLRNKLKCAVRAGDIELQNEYKEDISVLTKGMQQLRKNLKIYNRIKSRSETVMDKMDRLNEYSRKYERYTYDRINTHKNTKAKYERTLTI